MYIFLFLLENSIGEDMENSGITRRIDDLGRIVIPKEIRKNLRIRDNDEVEIRVIDNKIILNKYESLVKDKVITCLLCTLGKLLNKNVLFTSKDKVIDYYLKGKQKLYQEELSNSVINIIENRRKVLSGVSYFILFNKEENLSYYINPLIINGDLIGSIIVYDDENISKHDEDIIDFSKFFLENYLE